ncbi:hypothetical protein NQ318_004663 [Aromia moschata]|uniref:Sulfatase N-terminal domain-containing protein n=1 Tax=Aromia moschata TaxID=1265417 RepID=A0AAV8Y5S8_9CUCU|nr:hypothetical protein NQ318_004663 [Aromia moschata]
MQHLVILEPEPWGLPLNETLLPQHLKRNGYATHAIGKWHLGFFKKEYTPTYRGFDTHYGYWQGLQDYYEHTVHATYTSENGYDMRRDMTVDYSANGKYSTTLFTKEAVRLIHDHDISKPMFMYLAHLAPHTGNDKDPLQAPDEEIAKFAHIQDPERRIYAAMVSMLDQSVGSVITALREKHMLENSIIVFMSDNGAQPEGTHANHGSNYPLKGAKNSAWEGAMRNIAAIWSPLIKRPQRVSNHFMHITDWLPTFYAAAETHPDLPPLNQGTISEIEAQYREMGHVRKVPSKRQAVVDDDTKLNLLFALEENPITPARLDKKELPEIDGMDMWEAISDGSPSPRTELLYNIDDIYNYAAIRKGDWKYTFGSTNGGKADKWFENPGDNSLYKYDLESILSSKVASALAGVITYEQINEKNENIRHHREANFTVNLIDERIIEKLRNDATIKCQEVNLQELPDDSKCDLLVSPCLFNIIADPCEKINLASQKPEKVAELQEAIEEYKKTALPPRNVPRDPNADPARYNNTWMNWQDYEYVAKEKVAFNSLSPLAVGLLAAAGIMVFAIVTLLILLNRKGTVKRNRKHGRPVSLIDDAEDPVIEIMPKNSLFEDRELQVRTCIKDEIRRVE